MALRYTGRATTFEYGGKIYRKNPGTGEGDLSKPIPGLSREVALHMIECSTLHSFEEAGADLEEKVTAPTKGNVNA